MPQVPYWHVDAFAAAPFGGNQAAVMILEAWPDDAVLRAIGAENAFAETAFLVRDESGEADWELRWFTPASEVRLCGHATLASGHVLLGQERDRAAVTFRTRRAGRLEVRRDGETLALALPAIPVAPIEWPDAVAALGAVPDGVWRSPDGYSLLLYADEDAVSAIRPDFAALRGFGEEQFIVTARGRETDIVSRVFVPGAGVDEDSVTGSAHAVLAPFWTAHAGLGRFSAWQASARGGRLDCRVEGETVWLGGPCVTIVEGSFRF